MIPNDEPFIWLVYAPPNSGKSTFVANVILDKRWGFSGRRKNLITKEAAARATTRGSARLELARTAPSAGQLGFLCLFRGLSLAVGSGAWRG